MKFSGGVEPAPLEQALNELVRRHEPLRTIYPNITGKPVQIIQPLVPHSLPFEDYSGLPEEEQLAAIRSYVSNRGDQPFNLQTDPNGPFCPAP